MAYEDDSIKDLFRRFDTNEKSNNIDFNSTKSSNRDLSNKSEKDMYEISSNSS